MEIIIKKSAWFVLTCLIVSLMLLVSCTQAVVEEEEATKQPLPAPASNEEPSTSIFSEICVDASALLESSASIYWTTNEPATFFITYGLDATYGNVISYTGTQGTSQSGRININDLEPKTTYHFRIHAIDSDKNQSLSNDYTFTTLSPKGPLSARLFPWIPPCVDDIDWYFSTEPVLLDRVNTSLYNASPREIEVRRVEFISEDGESVFSLPVPSPWHAGKSDCFVPTFGRSDLPESWTTLRLAPGKLLFTGLGFNYPHCVTIGELEDWHVLWHCLDADGVEFTVMSEFSLVP